MNLAFTITNIVLSAIMAGIFGVWVYFITYMSKSFRLAPRLDSGENLKITRTSDPPYVSIVLPARNEEFYISKCLESLLSQDYSRFEIIAINDSSTDRTGAIIRQYASKDSRVVYVEAPPKPEDWVGKNWACYQGYLRSKGDLLLFTDADTVHSKSVISNAVAQMTSHSLDALSAVPRLICNDFWTKITLPALATFLYTRFSPLRVNDPKTKTGYFFGSFFVITRRTYESVGTHAGVRHELVEDGALGLKVKENKFKMRMVRGEQYIEAVWARDLPTLWHGLRRLMIPIYYQNKTGAYLMTIAVLFLLFVPFLVTPYLAISSFARDLSFPIFIGIESSTVLLIFVATAIQCISGLAENPAYAIAAPLSGGLISFGFISALVDSRKQGAVNWRGRNYTVAQSQHPI